MNKLFTTFLGISIAFSGFSQPTIQAFSPQTFENFPNVRDLSITSDESEMYFTVQSVRQDFSAIMVSKKNKKGWGKPEVVPFSGQYKDIEPFLSGDGLTLYFASNRPVPDRGGEKLNYDIWKVTRSSLNSDWSAPMNLGAPVNSEADEFYPSVASSGNLYFTAQRDGTKGKEDIFIARYQNDKYLEPESISEAVNSEGYEFNAFVSYDEQYILFTGYGREDGLGGGDLYISQKDDSGSWKQAKHLGSSINSKGLDYCPYILNGKLYLTSNRTNLKAAYDKPMNAEELVKELNKVENGKSRIYYITANGLFD